MTRYAFYTSSKIAWHAMLREVERAERSICLEMYILVDDDADGALFIDALVAKARRGVAVRLVLDGFGSFSLSRAALEKLKDAGAEVIFFSHWLERLHRKLLIVDEHIAIAGGVNIHAGARLWTDLAFKVSGRHSVRLALHAFAKTYTRAGGTDPAIAAYAKHSAGKTKVDFLHHWPGERRRTLRHLYEEKLRAAQSSVLLVTPYFVPDRWLMALLDQAALRGVRVDVIIPKLSDSWFMDRANHFYLLQMQKTKVHFFLYPKMNHAKVLVVDESEALVGSQNLDSLSFNRNAESGVVFSDTEVVGRILRIVTVWKGESRPIEEERYTRQWYDYVLAPVIRLFQPFL